MMKKTSVFVLLCVFLLGSCNRKMSDVQWHKYAIETCCIPESISLEKPLEKGVDSIKWYLQFHTSKWSTITKTTDRERIEQIAQEHGESGVGFYAISPILPCVYGVHKIEVVGYNGEQETALSHLVILSSHSIEPFIRRGYKNPDLGMLTPFDLPLDRITNYDYTPFPRAGFEYPITCKRGDIEGRFDRLEMRVMLKDGKTLCADMSL